MTPTSAGAHCSMHVFNWLHATRLCRRVGPNVRRSRFPPRLEFQTDLYFNEMKSRLQRRSIALTRLMWGNWSTRKRRALNREDTLTLPRWGLNPGLRQRGGSQDTLLPVHLSFPARSLSSPAVSHLV